MMVKKQRKKMAKGIKRGVKCPTCGTRDSMMAMVQIPVLARLNRNSTIKTGGVSVNQMKIKESWLSQAIKLAKCESCTKVAFVSKMPSKSGKSVMLLHRMTF